MSNLLPRNATKLEKNIEQLGEKISLIRVPFIDLHSIDRCPVLHLPWLAWEHRVEYWQPDWNEQDKRNAIRESESFNAGRGTRSSISSLISTVVDHYQLKAWYEFNPPQKPFTFVVIISPQYLLSIEQLLQVHTAIDATKSARDNYSISAKVKTTCDFYLTGSVTSGTKVYLSTYTDPFFWIVDSLIQFNGIGTATFTAVSSDGFNIYSTYANLDLTEAIVRSLHDENIQQWQAVKDACNELTGVTNWGFDSAEDRITYIDTSTPISPDSPTLQYYYIYNGQVSNIKVATISEACILAFKAGGWAGYDIPPIPSGYGCSLYGDSLDAYAPGGSLGQIGSRSINPAYDPDAEDDRKRTISLGTVTQKIISNTQSTNQAIALLAEAYLEKVANSIFSADKSKQFVELSDLTPQFELNKTLAN